VLRQLFLVCFVLSQPTVHASDEVLIKIVTESSPPISYFDPVTKEISGPATQLLRHIMKEANLDYDITILPWTRAIKYAKENKNTLIFSLNRTSEREFLFNWIGLIFSIKSDLYRLRSEVDHNYSVEELKSSKIAVIKNDFRHTYLSDMGFKNLIFVNNYVQIHKLIKRKRIIFFMSNEIGISQFIKNHHLNKNDVIKVSNFNSIQTNLYFAINKNTDEHIVKKLQQSYKNLKHNGTYQKIMKDYLKFN